MAALSPIPGSFHIDCTVGGGGHAARILEASQPDGRLLGLDADREAIARTRDRFSTLGDRVVLRQANFEELEQVATEAGFVPADGVLLDLGLSSYQLADETRAFSFRSTGPLDMRFDTDRGESAGELVARLDERSLTDLFRRWGEEPHARRIAAAVVAARAHGPIRTGAQLAEIVERSVPGVPSSRRRIHPATRVFQALRIAVNRELEVLSTVLDAAVGLLRPRGRLVVISYHSLEDRIVKRFIAAERRGCVCPPAVPVCVCGRSPRLAAVGKSLVRPTEHEIAVNPRARSARLRAAERVAA